MSEDSRTRTAWTAAVLAVMTAAFVVVKTGRDALYFLDDSLAQLPWAYLAIALSASPVAMGTIALMRRFGPRRVRIALPTSTTILLGLYHPFAAPGTGAASLAFFVLVPLIWGVMFSAVWLLGADLLDNRPRAELSIAYARIGAASIAGGMAGGVLARIVASHCTPADLLLFGSGLLVVAIALIGHIHRRYPQSAGANDRDQRDSAVEDAKPDSIPVLGNPYARAMLFAAVLAGGAGVLIEFQFYQAATSFAETGVQNVRFFASVYSILGAVALVLQLWVTPRLQRRSGVEGSLMVLPTGLLLGASAVIFGGGTLVMRSILRMAEGGLKSSIHRSNWEQAYLGLPRHDRTTAKVVIDGMGSRAGEAFSAILLLVWIRRSTATSDSSGTVIDWISWTLVLVAALWFAVTMDMWRRRPQLRTTAAQFEMGQWGPVTIPDS